MTQRLLTIVLVAAGMLMSVHQVQSQCPPVIGGANCEFPYKDCGLIPQECILCNSGELDGFCMTLTNIPNDDEPPSICGNGVFNNPSWFAFVAWNTSMNLQICPSNCQGVPGGFIGVQAVIYPTCPANPNNTAACQAQCQANCFNLISNSLVVGQTYYFAVDGCAGDICDITINCVSGCGAPQLNPVTAIAGPKKLCPNAQGIWNVSPLPTGAVDFEWTLDGNPIGTNSPTLSYSFPAEGNYEICADGYNDCIPVTDPPEKFCIMVEVKKIPDTQLPEKKMCTDSTFTFNGTQISGGSGDADYDFNIPTVPLMCDSVVKFHVSIIPDKKTNLGKITRCLGDNFKLGDSEFPDCGLYTVTVLQKDFPHCDSVIDFELDFVSLDAKLLTPDSVGCPPFDQVYVDGTPSQISNQNCGGTIDKGNPNFKLSWKLDGKPISGDDYIWTEPDAKPGTYCMFEVFTLPPGSKTANCKDSACVKVYYKDIPIVTFDSNPDTITCGGPAYVYGTSTKKVSYFWKGPGGFTSTDSVFAAPAPGDYYGTITDGSCKFTDTISIYADNNIPTVQVNGDFLNCSKVNATVTATTNASGPKYKWSGPGGFTGNTASVNVTQTGTYNVTITASNGCEVVGQASVTGDYVKPTISATSGTITCKNPNVPLDGIVITGGGGSFEWKGPGGTVIATTEDATTNGVGNYTFKVISANGCFEDTTITIPVNFTKADVTATGDSLTCSKTSATLTASSTVPGASFQWYDIGGGPLGTGSTQVVNNSGTYNVEVIHPLTGCKDSTTAVVSVKADIPIAQITSAKSVLNCDSSTLYLMGKNNNPVTKPNFNWSFGGSSIGTTNNITINQPGTYTLTLSVPATGCTDTVQYVITQDIVKPDANGIGGILNCFTIPKKVTLIGSSTYSKPNAQYTWLDPSGTPISSNDTVTVFNIGTFTFQVKNLLNGCISTDTAEVIVDSNAPQNVTTSVSDTLTCAVSQVSISANSSTAGVSYTWTGPGITGTSTNQTVNNITKPGVYTVSILNPLNNCDVVTTLGVKIDTVSPIASIVKPDTLTCLINSITLQGGGNVTSPSYQWSLSGNNLGTNATQNVNTIGTYTLEITNPKNGCKDLVSAQVFENKNLPTASATGGIINCKKNCITLNGTTDNGTIFNWTGPGISGATAGDQNQTLCDAQAGGTYVFSTTAPNGCANQDTAIIVADFQTPQNVSINGGELTCTSPTLTINLQTSTPNCTYDWKGPGINGTNQGQQDPLVDSDGTYEVVITAANGCTEQTSVTVTKNKTEPELELVGDLITCLKPNINIVANSSTSGVIIDWTGPTGPQNNTTSIATTLPGVYTSTATAPNGCKTIKTITIQETKDKPNVVVNNPTEIDCSNKTSFLSCAGSSQGSEYTYQWIGPESANACELTVSTVGVYTLTILNTVNGCSDSKNVTVTENVAKPTGLVGNESDPKCFGEKTGTYVVSNVIGGTPPYQYSLNNSPFSSNNTFTGLGQGNYYIKIIDAAGCEYEEQFSLDQPEKLLVELGDDQIINWGEIASVSAQIYPTGKVKNIQWQTSIPTINCNGPIDSCGLEFDLQLYNQSQFLITVTDSNGCRASDQVLILVKKDRPVYIPNSFSPDGTGDNDRFVVYGGDGVVGIEKIQIFDRWGQQVFSNKEIQVNDPSQSWDGRVDGRMSNPGVYVYYVWVKFKDGYSELYKGDVTLFRNSKN